MVLIGLGDGGLSGSNLSGCSSSPAVGAGKLIRGTQEEEAAGSGMDGRSSSEAMALSILYPKERGKEGWGRSGPVVKMVGRRWGLVWWEKRREAPGTRVAGRAQGWWDQVAVVVSHVIVLRGEEIGEGKGTDKWALQHSIPV
jgi:hypothetical protein